MLNKFLKQIQPHSFFVLGFGALYIALLWPLLTGQKGFTEGDYELQFYPWSWIYAEGLKEGSILLWTPLFESGFPLFAEGQTGMLYPFNLLFFKFLPFHLAYNSMFLFHFLMGGVWSYAFARSKGQSVYASTAVASAFTFGSAYAGCFYNIVAMRSLVWFPLCLLLVDLFLKKANLSWLLVLSSIFAFSWLGGFPQMTVYLIVFTALYFYLQLLPRGLFKTLFYSAAFIMSIFLGCILAAPQIWASLLLALHSTRTGQEASFALWGSMAPWSLLSLFFFSWSSFLRVNLYISAPLLLCVALLKPKKSTSLWWILILISFFLALGSFNPFYWLIIHLPGASLFRNPSKFVFFMAFFLAMLGGFSLDRLAEELRKQPSNSLIRKFFIISSALSLFAVFAYGLVHKSGHFLTLYGNWYVEKFVKGKSYHKLSSAEYLTKVQQILSGIQNEIRWDHFIFWVPFIFLFSTGLLLWFFSKYRKKDFFRPLVVVLILLDLSIFGLSRYGTGFKGNIGYFPEFKSSGLEGRSIDLTKNKDVFLPPNKNALSGVESPGAYSPLLDKDYYERAKNFALLDDSFGRTNPSWESAERHRDLLNYLGIRYIALDKDVRVPTDLEFLRETKNAKIYENTQASPGYLFLGGKARIKPILQQNIQEIYYVDAEYPGLFIRNTRYEAGWMAFLDKKPVDILKAADVLQGVAVPPGKHELRFLFNPDYWRIGIKIYCVTWISLILLLTLLTIKPMRVHEL